MEFRCAACLDGAMATAQPPSNRSPDQLRLFGRAGYLTIEDVAELLSVPRSFIYRRTARGHGDPIPHYRVGGHLRFKFEDVEAWMEGHRKEAATEPAPTLVAALRREPVVRSTRAVVGKPMRRHVAPSEDH